MSKLMHVARPSPHELHCRMSHEFFEYNFRCTVVSVQAGQASCMAWIDFRLTEQTRLIAFARVRPSLVKLLPFYLANAKAMVASPCSPVCAFFRTEDGCAAQSARSDG